MGLLTVGESVVAVGVLLVVLTVGDVWGGRGGGAWLRGHVEELEPDAHDMEDCAELVDHMDA